MFGAVDERLASCMMVHFQVWVFKWQLVCVWYGGEGFFDWFLTFSHVLYITSFAYYFFSQMFLLSNSFYTKYFVLSFSINVCMCVKYTISLITLQMNALNALVYCVVKYGGFSFLLIVGQAHAFQHRSIFRVTGPLCRKSTGHWWIPRTFLSAPGLSKQSWS